MEFNSKIFVLDHLGFVGSALVNLLKDRGYTNILTRTKEECDLRNQNSAKDFFITEKPDYVFITLSPYAKSDKKSKFIYDSLLMKLNIIELSRLNGVKRIVHLVSSIYSKNIRGPVKEKSLLSEPINLSDNISSIFNLTSSFLCQSYSLEYKTQIITAVVSDLYGICGNSTFPKFIDCFCNVKDEVEVLGSNMVESDLLYIDDCADVLIFMMNNSDICSSLYNIGTGKCINMKDLVSITKDLTGFNGSIKWNIQSENETSHTCLDVSRINKLGWSSKTTIEEGLQKIIETRKRL